MVLLFTIRQIQKDFLLSMFEKFYIPEDIFTTSILSYFFYAYNITIMFSLDHILNFWNVVK